MDSSDEDEDEEDDIRWRLRYSRWSIGNDDDDAGAYKAALGRVGRRAKDRCGEPGRDGGRVGVCSLRGRRAQGNYHPANHTRGRKTFSHIPFQCPPLSNHLAHITFVHRYQRTLTSSIVGSIHRSWEARQISTTTISIQGSRWRARCQCPPGSLSTRRLGSRQPYQYRNHDRVLIRTVADRGWIRHAREGEIHSSQERILQSRGRIHSPHPLVQVLEGDVTMEEDKQSEDLDIEKEMDDHGDRPLREISKHSTLIKDRTTSMDSEASVYTQNCISSGAPLSLPAIKATSRPAPLNLTQQPSPLLVSYTY